MKRLQKIVDYSGMGTVILLLMLAMIGMPLLSGCGGGGGGGGSVVNTAPTAHIAVVPSGPLAIGQTFSLDASDSTDAETASAALKVRWDWQNDGVWDTASSTLKNPVVLGGFSTAGQHTIRLAVSDAGGLTNETTIIITVFSVACATDIACNDNDPSTIDACINPGAANSSCSHTSIACSTDLACDDGNALTADTCNAPGTPSSNCSHTAVACNTVTQAVDCNDSNAHTEDTCSNGGTTLAICNHAPIACLSNGDSNCNDGNALTIDTCSNAGTTSSACVNTAFVCNTANDCNDSNEMTFESCTGGGTLGAVCGHAAIACVRNSQCDDSDWRTTDTCVNAGQPAPTSVCSRVLNVLCRSDTDCNCQPGDPGCYNDTPFAPPFYGVCVNPLAPDTSQCQITM